MPSSAEINQDFITFAGDDPAPIFTVRNSAGQPVDISTVNNIIWLARRNADDTNPLTKTKAAGDILLLNGGTLGQFQVNIDASDTAAMSGWYEHLARIVDPTNKTTTVAVGRMQVGIKPEWTYDPGQIATNSLYAIRDLIGDTKIGDQLLFDGEIQAALAAYPNTYLAAAEACRKIAARFARDVDTQEGELRKLYSSRQRAYRSLAVEMERLGYSRGGVQGYAGGISISDKSRVTADEDRVAPQFNIGMTDNFLPIGPVGNEQPTSPSPEGISFP